MQIRNIGEVSVGVLVPRFDAYTANDVEAVLREEMSRGAKKLMIDFSETEYIASAGLRVLLSVAKNLRNVGGKIVLYSMKPSVYDVFSVSGFTQIFKIYSTEQEALDNLK
jgi:anti-anti-sigma factor